MRSYEQFWFMIGLAVSLCLHMLALMLTFSSPELPQPEPEKFTPLHIAFGDGEAVELVSHLPEQQEVMIPPLPNAEPKTVDIIDDESSEIKEEPNKNIERMTSSAIPIVIPPVPDMRPSTINKNSSESVGEKIGNGVFGSRLLTYEQMLPLWLERFKRYPEQLGDTRLYGKGIIFLSVSRSGHILKYKLKKSTGHVALDRALIQMVRDANPAIPFPKDYRPSDKTVSYEIEFGF